MKLASPSPSEGHSDPCAHTRGTPGSTPNADMQAEDTGSAGSGTVEHVDSGSAATRAMKQTSKTSAESDVKR